MNRPVTTRSDYRVRDRSGDCTGGRCFWQRPILRRCQLERIPGDPLWAPLRMSVGLHEVHTGVEPTPWP